MRSYTRSSSILLAALASSALLSPAAHAAWSYDPPQGLRISYVANPTVPVVEADGSGGLFVAWFATSPFGLIHVQHVLGSGDIDSRWPVAGIVPDQNNQQSNAPALMADGHGGVVLVCNDTKSGGQWRTYAFHILEGGDLDAAWPAGGALMCAAAYNQKRPLAVSDGTGGALASWQDFRGSTDNDVYAAHADQLGSVSPLDDLGSKICNASNSQNVTAMSPDLAGGAFVAWQTFVPSQPNERDIYVHHMLPDATADPVWPSNGLAVCTAPGSQGNGKTVIDGSGGVFVAWDDSRGSSTQTYLHHVLAGGTLDPAWPVTGLAVDPTANSQALVAVLRDAGNGVLAVYQDASLIRVQHLSSAGVSDPAWPAGGRSLAVANAAPAALSDGVGGAIVVWGTADEALDIYSQHVLGNGAIDPAWPAAGRAVSIAPGAQGYPSITSDGAGGAFAGWEDVTNYGVFVGRVPVSGNLGVTPGSVAAGSLRAWPNPARTDVALTLQLARPQHASLSIQDLTGRRVRLLVEGNLESGARTLHWDLRDDRGRNVAAGLYFIRMSGADRSSTTRLVVCR